MSRRLREFHFLLNILPFDYSLANSSNLLHWLRVTLNHQFPKSLDIYSVKQQDSVIMVYKGQDKPAKSSPLSMVVVYFHLSRDGILCG